MSRKRYNGKEVNIYWNYRKMDQCEEMKYLGIYFDSKFNFNAYIDYTVTKLIYFINMIARTARLQSGLGHKALKTIYEGAVVPILTYGAPVWVEAIRKTGTIPNTKEYKD